MKKIGPSHKQASSIHLTNRNILSSITLDISNQQYHYLNQSPYLQSFAYTDHITSKILPIDCDASIKCNDSFSKSYDYTNCFGLMKSTRRFHMSTLKEKNYKQINQSASLLNTQTNEFNNKQKLKKYIIRKQTQKQNFAKQKLNLTKLLNNDGRYQYASADVSLNLSPRENYRSCEHNTYKRGTELSLNQGIINKNITQQDQLQKNTFNNICQTPTKITNGENKKLAETLSIIQEYDQFQRKQKQKYVVKNGDIKNKQQILNMDQLSMQVKKYVQKLDRELRHQITKDAQYLVTPNNFHLSMADKIKSKNKKNNQKREKPVIIKETNTKLLRRAKILNLIQANAEQNSMEIVQPLKQSKVERDFQSELKQYSFRTDNNNKQYKVQNDNENQKYSKNTQLQEQKSLIRSIIQGNYFKVEIQLSLNNNLLRTKEARSKNNLLHLCILNNQKQIYEMIVAKCKQFDQDLLNQPNKYNKTPLQLAKVYKFINLGSKPMRHTVGIK